MMKYEYTYKPYESDQVTFGQSGACTSVETLDEDSALAIMIAAEPVLRRDWDTPEEDEAWAQE